MVPTRTEPPAANREIITVDRPGGFKMPLLTPQGDVVRRKEYGERRHEINRILRRNHDLTVNGS
jgi:hypothetical protein